MRQIKFRAWNKVAEFMLQWEDFIGYETDQQKIVENDYRIFNDKEFELMQFTGLFDKNGTEIYEGDIISVNGKYPKIIKYLDKSACFGMANIEDLKNENWKDIWQQVNFRWWNDFDREIEIIGNIHENKYLLK